MLLIDRREPEKLKKMLLDLGEESELAYGDYMWFSAQDLSVVVERKAIGDLLSSLSSGRLYSQFQNIATFDIPILLVEGIYSPSENGFIRLPSTELRFRYEAVENLLLDAQMRGIILARTPSLEASARLIRGYYKYLTSSNHRFQVRKLRYFSYTGKVTPQIRLVCALPGVDYVLGQRLLDYFGTPIGVFTATPSELADVEGIGRKKAEVIYESLRTGDKQKPQPSEETGEIDKHSADARGGESD